ERVRRFAHRALLLFELRQRKDAPARGPWVKRGGDSEHCPKGQAASAMEIRARLEVHAQHRPRCVAKRAEEVQEHLAGERAVASEPKHVMRQVRLLLRPQHLWSACEPVQFSIATTMRGAKPASPGRNSRAGL